MGQAKLRKRLTPWISSLASPHATMMLTTPQTPLSPRIRHLCQAISPTEPVFLEYSDFGYGAQECHVNVLHHIKQHGGRRSNGWVIWESLPFDEAEFHCVWESPYGNLLDLTPRVDNEELLLFLPDSHVISRLTLGPNGGLVLPCNRTTHPAFPFTFQGRREVNSTIENVLHDSVHQYMARFGITIHELV